MQTDLTLLNIVLLTSIVVGVFLGISLLTIRKGNLKANRILGILLLVISALLGLAFYYNRTPVMDCPHLFSAATPIPLLFGPLLYFYVKVRLYDRFEFRVRDLIHLIPFILLLGLQLSYSFLPIGPRITLAGALAQDAFGVTNRTVLLNIFKILFNLGYVWASLSIIAKWNKDHTEKFSKQSSLHLGWMKRLSWFVGLYWIGFSMVFIYQVIININMVIVDNLLSVSLSLVTLGIGFIALQKPDIYIQDKLVEEDEDKYKKSSLETKRLTRISTLLQKTVVDDKLYLNQQLTLKELAETLEVSQHYLSQTLSRHLNTNFFEFVNRYRVEHAQDMLTDPEYAHLTILAIAEESGFNSKASFNRAFKKFTGVTPSQFQKQNTSYNN